MRGMRLVLWLSLAIALILPSSAWAGPCNPAHPCPTPEPVAMGRVFYTGFELNSSVGESFTGDASILGTGPPTFETGTVRTGARSLRVNISAAQTGFYSPTFNRLTPLNTWARFYMNVTTLPGSERPFAGRTSVNFANLRINAAGQILYYDAGNTLKITSTDTLSTGTWYMIEYRTGASAGVSLRINGVDQGGSITPSISFGGELGDQASGGSAYNIVFDDFTVDDTTWPGAGGVVLLSPTADSSRGTGWVGGGGGTNNLFDAVNNLPSIAVADPGTDASQIRNATAAANSNMDMTMTTYTAAGVPDGATVNSVWPFTWTAAPVSTGAKQGTIGVASNPIIANIALSSGGVAGAFWSGVAGGTFPTGWKLSRGTLTSNPAVTLGTAPVMRITQVTSSTRIAMVGWMGMYVDYTPGVAARVPRFTPYPQLLAH